MDYIGLALSFKEVKDDGAPWFKEWFEKTVESAEKQWNRPESVFQHIPALLQQSLGGKYD